MTGIQCQQDLAGYRVTKIEFMRAGCVAFGADAEELRFHGIDIVFLVDPLFENGIKRFDQAFARDRRPIEAIELGGEVLETDGVVVARADPPVYLSSRRESTDS